MLVSTAGAVHPATAAKANRRIAIDTAAAVPRIGVAKTDSKIWQVTKFGWRLYPGMNSVIRTLLALSVVGCGSTDSLSSREDAVTSCIDLPAVADANLKNP